MRNSIRPALIVVAVFLLSAPAMAGDPRPINLGFSAGAGMGYGWAHVATASGGGSTTMDGDGLVAARGLIAWRPVPRFAWGAEYLAWSLGDDSSHEIDLKLAAFNFTWFPEDSAMYARVGCGWGRIETSKTILWDDDNNAGTPDVALVDHDSGDAVAILGSVGYLIYFSNTVALDLGVDITFLKELGGTEAHMGALSAGIHIDL